MQHPPQTVVAGLSYEQWLRYAGYRPVPTPLDLGWTPVPDREQR